MTACAKSGTALFHLLNGFISGSVCCKIVSDADIIVPGIGRPVLTRGPLCQIYWMFTRVVPCLAGWFSDADIIVPGIGRPVLTREPLYLLNAFISGTHLHKPSSKTTVTVVLLALAKRGW